MLLTFLCVLILFHASEVTLVVIFNRPELEWSSLLITQPYSIALSLGVMEYIVRGWLLGASPIFWPISAVGMAMIVVGEVMRKTAMIQAGAAFTHRIKTHKRPQHVMVSSGLYAHLRHPGYFGWFLWSIGTQVLLCNPIAAVAFTFVVCKFFRNRIPAEERTLLQLFGRDYEEYALRTPVRVSGIGAHIAPKTLHVHHIQKGTNVSRKLAGNAEPEIVSMHYRECQVCELEEPPAVAAVTRVYLTYDTMRTVADAVPQLGLPSVPAKARPFAIWLCVDLDQEAGDESSTASLLKVLRTVAMQCRSSCGTVEMELSIIGQSLSQREVVRQHQQRSSMA